MADRLNARHLAFLVLGLLAGYAIAYFGPADATLAPQTRILRERLHDAVLERAKADSGLVRLRVRVAAQNAALARLGASQDAQRASSQRLASRNQRLADSLAIALAGRPESAAVVELGRGIALQGAACEGALSACDSAKAVLRERIVGDSLRAESSLVRERRTLVLASDATESATAWEGTAARVKVQRNVLAVIAVVLAGLVLVR